MTLVIASAFGLSLLASVASLAAPSSAAPISELMLRSLFVQELVVLAILAWFLRVRGWTVARVGLDFAPRDLVAALSLWILVLGTVWFARMAVGTLFGHHSPLQSAGHLVARDLTLPTIIVVSCLNAFYEELFVSGYLINAVKPRRGLWPAVNASMALRLAYHLYQGGTAVVSILPVGLVFGYWYGRYNRLWPLVLAHVAIDVVSLASLGR